MINIKPIEGKRNSLTLIDQTLLPLQKTRVTLTQLSEIADAIKRLVVRGAPAIGIAAAYGLCVHIEPSQTLEELKHRFQEAFTTLAATRPTAVNLFWALNQMQSRLEALLESSSQVEEIKSELFKQAKFIEEEDYRMCRQIGEHSFQLIEDKSSVRFMTICNAGGLATSGYGTALACFYMAKEKGKNIRVFVLETRPLLQGARLTTYELLEGGIPTTLLIDNMAGFLMKQEKIDLIITGADRITANGDTANKIGTYQLAVLAKHHGIPFYVAAPYSTFDLNLKSGEQIPIEFRGKEEIIRFAGVQTAPEAVDVFSPAFDITPASLISGIITEKGVFTPPYRFR